MLTIRRAAVASVLIALSAPVFAQDLAVKDRTPANPLLIVSVADSPGFWKSLGESKFGKLIEREITLPGMTPQERAPLEKALGFSLEPEDLFTQTVKGFDAYFLQVNDEPGFVVNFALRDSSTATKVLDQVKKECATAQGSAGGVSASTVVDTVTAAGVRQLSLPAFQIYLAADGSTLVWSNQKESLESAFRDEGKAIFASDYFKRYMDQLSNDPGKVWIFGEVTKLAPVSDLEVFSLGAAKGSTLGMKIDADKKRAKVTVFQHQEDMPSAQKRYTLTAPAAGDIGVVNYFPEGTNFLFGTNHFDGTSILEMVTESTKGDDEAPLSSKKIDEKVQSGKALLGFDAKEDVLANLGPDFGFGITKSDADKDAKFPFDLVVVSHVKNRERFEAVLKTLEDSASASAAPAARRRPPKNADPNAATPAPTPEPTPAIQTEDFEGETIKFTSSVPGAKESIGDVQPGYALTKDDYFIFALNKNSVKNVLTASKGSKGISDSNLMKDANEQLAKNRNSIMMLDATAIYEILDKNKDKFTSALSADRKAEFEKVMNYLQSVRSFSSTSSFTADGKKQEVVLLF